jgi:hypothetical protein
MEPCHLTDAGYSTKKEPSLTRSKRFLMSQLCTLLGNFLASASLGKTADTAAAAASDQLVKQDIRLLLLEVPLCFQVAFRV